MQKYELINYAKVFGITVLSVIVFSYIWRFSKVIGMILVVAAFCAFAYFGLDWAHWSTYFFADPNAY